MGLVRPTSRREKILLYGPTKVGKTSAWLSIAWWAWKSGDHMKFWIMDTDDAVGDVILDEKYNEMGNLEVFIVDETDWAGYETTAATIRDNCKPGDWIVIDFADRAWKAVQNWATQETKQKSRDETMLEAAKKGAEGWDLFREIPWPVVNSRYDSFIKPLLLQTPGVDLFFVCAQKDIGAEGKGKESDDVKRARREFGRYIPGGQKDLPYQSRSVLRLDRLARGRVLYTAGDRARKELAGDLMNDFFTTYLRGVAGWTIDTGEVAEGEKVT